jgi:hypothetical protein
LKLHRGGGHHEQLTSNNERFKWAFAERDKKQTVKDESQQTGLKTSQPSKENIQHLKT